ncbi:MAG: cyclic nucleotide-binding domain-containing protein [Acidimicrobiia bacterium]|jgi:CRP-like cAMP-binding protein
MDKVEMLKVSSIFAALSKKQLESIAATSRILSFSAGDAIIEEGEDRSIGFYVLGSGTAEVTKDGAVVATYGSGDYFGEIALLSDDTARTATVRATSDAEVLGLTKWDFRALVSSEPDIAVQVMGELARRVAETEAVTE